MSMLDAEAASTVLEEKAWQGLCQLLVEVGFSCRQRRRTPLTRVSACLLTLLLAVFMAERANGCSSIRN